MLVSFLHIFFLVLAAVFSSYLAFVGVSDYISGDIQRAQAMNVVALLTLVFTLRHSYLYLNYGLEVRKLVAFPVIYLALAMGLDISLGNAIELWLPLTTVLADQLPVSVGWLVALVLAAAIFSSEY